MVDTSPPLSGNKNQSQKQQNNQVRPPELQKLIHELVNELTIMNLYCFKIRGGIASAFDASTSAEIEKMEKAIADMTASLERLTQSNKHAPIQSTRCNAGRTQIFPEESATNRFILCSAGTGAAADNGSKGPGPKEKGANLAPFSLRTPSTRRFRTDI